MKNWVASKTLLCVCGLAIVFPVCAGAADWDVKQPKGYYNQGYGDFPPSDIEQRQFQDLPRDEKITARASNESQAENTTQAASKQVVASNQQQASPAPQASSQVPQAPAQPAANQGYYSYGAYPGYQGYQYPAGGYYGYGYPGYGYGYPRHHKKHKGFNFSGSPFDWDDDGPFDFGSNSWDRPWGGSHRSWGRDRYRRPYDRDHSGFNFGNNHRGDGFNWGW